MIFALLSLATSAAATGASVGLETDVSIHNPRTSMWSNNGPAPPTEEMTLTVALTVAPEARAALEKVFWAVSDPKNPKYGQHTTKAALKQTLAVPSYRVSRVQEHFLTHGASSAVASAYDDMLTVKMPVAAVERALQTTISAFTHIERPDVRILRASAGYKVPLALSDDIAMVDLLQFPRLRPKHLEEMVPTNGMVEEPNALPNSCDESRCASYVTPGVLAAQYKLPADYNSTAPMAGSMAVAEFQGQYFKHTDIETFSEECSTSVVVKTIIGGNIERAGIEAELDIEYIRGVSPGIDLTVIYSTSYSLLNWANNLMDLDDPPLVNSVSYGNDEAQQTGVAYMESVNTAFMKAGAMGLSILFASGDQGVCGREGCGVGTRKKFHPDFPGGSPYHTSVGGTDLYTKSVLGEETAWRSGGGGFSDTFPIPDYQKDVVASYKADLAAAGLLPDSSLYNDTGRGYPDVSALGGQVNAYCVYVGRWAGVAGTSASSPVVAGIFARLNALRLSKGNAPLGFLNPFIYQNPQAFQDVVHGINSDKQSDGFTAIKGWDAATGMGTPDYGKMAAAINAMTH
jgi:tripeptidyl-peptidase-1